MAENKNISPEEMEEEILENEEINDTAEEETVEEAEEAVAEEPETEKEKGSFFKKKEKKDGIVRRQTIRRNLMTPRNHRHILTTIRWIFERFLPSTAWACG